MAIEQHETSVIVFCKIEKKKKTYVRVNKQNKLKI